MNLPGEQALRTERAAIVETMHSLTSEEFESAPTLCAGWAPRDILAHVMGVDRALLQYFRAGGWISTGNALIVRRARANSRDELLREADEWQDRPAPWTRAGALWLLGDNGIHHQDVLRPLGRTRDIPEETASAMLREGALLGARRLAQYRVEPTDGGRAIGRGQVVRGTREALAMWLGGRQGVETELDFVEAAAA